MYEYDATDRQIERLQLTLAQNGISKARLDLSDYAGLTYSELKGIVDSAIKKYGVGGTECQNQ